MTARETANLLRLLAEHVTQARTKSRARILDASDFRAWLNELADEAEKSEARKFPAPKKKSARRLAA